MIPQQTNVEPARSFREHLPHAKTPSLEVDEAQRRLEALFHLAPYPMVILDAETGQFIDANQAAEKLFGLSRSELLGKGPFDLSPIWQPDGLSLELGKQRIVDALEGKYSSFCWWHCNSKKERFPCEVHLVKIPWGNQVAIRGSILESGHQKLLELSEICRHEVNDRLASGESLQRTLDHLLTRLECLLPPIRCSILRLDRSGSRLRHLSAPSLPEFYSAAVDGLEIGPTVGSCGAAAFHRKPVIVSDIANHPNWASFVELAEQAGLKACWSEPILALDGDVLGTFAMYWDTPMEPSPFEKRAITAVAQVASSAIELSDASEQLHKTNLNLRRIVDKETEHLVKAKRQLELAAIDARLSAVAFEARDSIVITDADGRILRVNESFTKLTGYTPYEAVGKTPAMLRSGRHEVNFYEDMWREISTKGFWTGEVWNRRKDGHVYLQRLTITAVRDNRGEITHYVSNGHDLTQEKNAESIRSELVAASNIQQCLLPSEAPSIPGFDIYGEVQAACEIGGDFFDFIRLDKNRTLLVVADVSGHGLGPGLLMAQMQSFLRCMPEVCLEPAEMLIRANRFFCKNESNRFITMFLGCLDSSNNTFQFACAGHQGYLLRGNEDAVVLKSRCTPLGILETWENCEQSVVHLKPGDTILIPTDGIEESMRDDGESFGRDRIFEIARRTKAKSAYDTIARLWSAQKVFANGAKNQDDCTMVVLKVLDP